MVTKAEAQNAVALLAQYFSQPDAQNPPNGGEPQTPPPQPPQQTDKPVCSGFAKTVFLDYPTPEKRSGLVRRTFFLKKEECGVVRVPIKDDGLLAVSIVGTAGYEQDSRSVCVSRDSCVFNVRQGTQDYITVSSHPSLKLSNAEKSGTRVNGIQEIGKALFLNILQLDKDGEISITMQST